MLMMDQPMDLTSLKYSLGSKFKITPICDIKFASASTNKNVAENGKGISEGKSGVIRQTASQNNPEQKEEGQSAVKAGP